MRRRLLRLFIERTRIFSSNRFVVAIDAFHVIAVVAIVAGSNREHRCHVLVHCNLAFQLAVFGSVAADLLLYTASLLDDIIVRFLDQPALQSRRDSSSRRHGLGHCERGE